MGIFWRGLAQAWIDAKSRDLAEQDFGERDGDRPKGEDHELHAAGQVCAYCAAK